jgi:photosystem II stability/assembly factor-like uncharacterized protein
MTQLVTSIPGSGVCASLGYWLSSGAQSIARILTLPKGLTYETTMPVARGICLSAIERASRIGLSVVAQGWGVLAILGTLMATPSAASAATSSGVREHLYAAEVLPDGRRAFAVGAFGSIFRSDDGGRSWEQQRTSVTEPLFGVSFVTADRGVVVGKSGTVLRTTDGGQKWERAASPTDKHLFAVTMIDAERGWAVGDWGVVLSTSDGGATWADRSLGQDVVLSAVCFADDRHGWIVGEFGTVLATADGGAAWTPQSAGTEKTLFGVAFSSPERGWAVGMDGLVLRTRDGGVTWEVQRGQAGAGSLEELGFMDLLTNPGLYDIAIGRTAGWIVGDTGTVLATTDGGETWEARKLPEDARLLWLRGAAVSPDGAGLMVGAKGLVVPTAGGELRPSHQKEHYAARTIR